ncbi:MAG: hypothetical protein RLZZ488_603 [Pseudomonadota bacterium]|jgi:hypothetical protein
MTKKLPIQYKIGFFSVLIPLLGSCKQRAYNQSKTKDLVVAGDAMVTVCTLVGPPFQEASPDSKASVRVSCQGKCNGADYRGRKFYVGNDEKVKGIEFSASLSGGKELRGLFIVDPENTLLTSLTSVRADHPEIQKSLAQYAIDPATVSAVSIPADARLLLMTGTRASLSSAGLNDGGTLDCGGQPIEGAIDLEQFKEQNLNEVRNSAASP